jgi:hypothetical protein
LPAKIEAYSLLYGGLEQLRVVSLLLTLQPQGKAADRLIASKLRQLTLHRFEQSLELPVIVSSRPLLKFRKVAGTQVFEHEGLG